MYFVLFCFSCLSFEPSSVVFGGISLSYWSGSVQIQFYKLWFLIGKFRYVYVPTFLRFQLTRNSTPKKGLAKGFRLLVPSGGVHASGHFQFPWSGSDWKPLELLPTSYSKCSKVLPFAQLTILFFFSDPWLWNARLLLSSAMSLYVHIVFPLLYDWSKDAVLTWRLSIPSLILGLWPKPCPASLRLSLWILKRLYSKSGS